MNVTLPAEWEKHIDQSVQEGAFASVSEFVEAAARRQMQEAAHFERRVLEGLQGSVTPLTREDLESVRNLIKPARVQQAA